MVDCVHADLAELHFHGDGAMSNERKYRCSFEGCHRSTTQHPYLAGWANLGGWGPGIPEGFYCKPHADAIVALDESGEIEYIQRSGGALDQTDEALDLL